ncbi:MAG: DUF262 domain-containing protein [Muribaculaceae bacterium]|nr:DUF262 domain-containing protein [Muribaculaceae bacterium]
MELFDSLDLIPVSKLLSNKFRFFVPAYQRGYRWTAEQVEQLIDDLMEFYNYHYSTSARSKFYCLQPLVVKLRKLEDVSETKGEEDEYLEVIDGQQRLTTILLLLQVLHLLKYESFFGTNAVTQINAVPDVFTIKYETRPESAVWLKEVNTVVYSEEAFDEFDQKNCDYSHFAEVFSTAYKRLKQLSEDSRNHFGEVLREGTKFIWYYPTEISGTNAEVFDSLNDGKIGLNNAELVKALLLQRSNWSDSDASRLQLLALQWNEMETYLQQKEFWGFIYSSQHPYTYTSHIEYLLDLLQRKNGSYSEKHFYTFNRYLEDYREMMKSEGKNNPSARAAWAEKCWLEVKSLFDTLKEWYKDKKMYHRIGFILEYVEGETVLSLKDKLLNRKHTERISLLDDIIRTRLSRIRSQSLFHGKAELSEILFIYNILLEDKRIADNARFSFADYKGVRKNKGWDQEHVASYTEYTPDPNKQADLAKDIIELLSGSRPQKTDGFIYELAGIAPLEGEEKKICEDAIKLLNRIEISDTDMSSQNIDDNDSETTDIEILFSSVTDYFETKKDNFGLQKVGGREKEEKNFIWNFVLLNSATNRSYGNHIYPVKRRRILQDEFDVYTPVGTRNVFEKAYSKKIDQMFYWTKTDAIAYWEDIKNTLKPYVELSLPFDKK